MVNKVINKYELEIKNSFGLNVYAVIETTKNDLEWIMEAKLENGLLLESLSKIHMYQLANGVEILSNEGEQIKLERDNIEQDIDKVSLMLTKQLEVSIIKVKANMIANILRKKGLDVINYNHDRDSSAEVYISNMENRTRNIIFYLENGLIEYSISDDNSTEEELDQYIDLIYTMGIEDFSERWLKGEHFLDSKGGLLENN